MQTEYLHDTSIDEAERNEVIHAEVEAIVHRHTAEMAGMSEAAYAEATALEGVGEHGLSREEILRRYDERTADYRWARFSRDTFEERIAMWEGVESFLKVKIGVAHDAAIAGLQGLAATARQLIEKEPADTDGPLRHLNDLADELVELYGDDLRAIKEDAAKNPARYTDSRLEELEAAIKMLASDKAVRPHTQLPASGQQEPQATGAIELAFGPETAARDEHQVHLGAYVVSYLVGKVRHLAGATS